MALAHEKRYFSSQLDAFQKKYVYMIKVKGSVITIFGPPKNNLANTRLMCSLTLSAFG